MDSLPSRLEALAARATPLPWKACSKNESWSPEQNEPTCVIEYRTDGAGSDEGDYGGMHVTRGRHFDGSKGHTVVNLEADVRLLVTLRNAVPAIVAALRLAESVSATGLDDAVHSDEAWAALAAYRAAVAPLPPPPVKEDA